MKLLIMQFYTSLCYFLSLSSKCFRDQTSLKHLQPTFKVLSKSAKILRRYTKVFALVCKRSGCSYNSSYTTNMINKCTFTILNLAEILASSLGLIICGQT
jgi:hypothetical protein